MTPPPLVAQRPAAPLNRCGFSDWMNLEKLKIKTQNETSRDASTGGTIVSSVLMNIEGCSLKRQAKQMPERFKKKTCLSHVANATRTRTRTKLQNTQSLQHMSHWPLKGRRAVLQGIRCTGNHVMSSVVHHLTLRIESSLHIYRSSPLHAVRHVGRPCFYRSPERTNQAVSFLVVTLPRSIHTSAICPYTEDKQSEISRSIHEVDLFVWTFLESSFKFRHHVINENKKKTL